VILRTFYRNFLAALEIMAAVIASLLCESEIRDFINFSWTRILCQKKPISHLPQRRNYAVAHICKVPIVPNFRV